MVQDHRTERHCASDPLPLHSSTAIEIGVGGIEQFDRLLLLDRKCRRSPGKPGSTGVRDSTHKGFDVSQSHPRQDDGELVTAGSEHAVGCPQPFTESIHQ
jgi:hypothetical protein